MATNYANKREVREAVKSHLQPFVEQKLIESEDIRELIKSVSDTIDVPVASSDVEQKTLETLISTLEGMAHVQPEQLQQVKERLARMQASPAAPVVTEPSSSKGGAAPASEKASLSLDDFKTRMAKKREELEKRRRDSAPVTTTASIAVSPKNSTVTSPGLVSADAPSAAPPTLELEETCSSKADQKSVGEAPAAPLPEKKMRVEPEQVPLTLSVALPETEEDLYGDLTKRTRVNTVDKYKTFNQNNYYQNSSYKGRNNTYSVDSNNYYSSGPRPQHEQSQYQYQPPQYAPQHQYQHQQQQMGYPSYNARGPYRNNERYPPSEYPHYHAHSNYYQ